MKRVLIVASLLLLLTAVVLAHPAEAHQYVPATSETSCGNNNSARIYYLNGSVLWCQGFTGYGYLGISISQVEDVTAYAQLWIKVYTPGFPQGLYCYIPSGHNVNVNLGQVHQIDPGSNMYGNCPDPIN